MTFYGFWMTYLECMSIFFPKREAEIIPFPKRYRHAR